MPKKKQAEEVIVEAEPNRYVAVITDTHAGVRNSGDVFIENACQFYEKTFFPTCDRYNVKQILHLGDYYDNRRVISIKAINANRKSFLEPMHERDMHMDIIPGNHDTFFKNTNDLNSLKELLGYYKTSVKIHMNPSVIEYANGFKIAVIPWINSSNYADIMKFVETAEAAWLGGHLELAGYELMKGHINEHGMAADLFDRYERVLSGHYHTKNSKGNVTYLGAPLEFTWSDCNDDKFFHILDTKTRELIAIKNDNCLFYRIYYNDELRSYDNYKTAKLKGKHVKIVVVKKKDLFAFDRFVERVQNAVPSELKIVETFDEYMGANVEDGESMKVEDTMSLVDAYIDATTTDLDKNLLKNFTRQLYAEASNMGV